MRLDDAVLAFGEIAAHVLIAKAALQRQARACPLILNEERVGHRSIARQRGPQTLCQLVRNPIVEAIADLLAQEGWCLRHHVRTLIADLEAVRTGDVRERRAILGVLLIGARRRRPAVVYEVRHRRAGSRRLLGHRDLIDRCTNRTDVAPLGPERREARFDKDAAGPRRRVGGLHDLGPCIPDRSRLR